MNISCPFPDCSQPIAIEEAHADTVVSCPACDRLLTCPSLAEIRSADASFVGDLQHVRSAPSPPPLPAPAPSEEGEGANKGAELLKEHLAQVPEPLQSVIQERFNDDTIGNSLKALSDEFSLTSEQDSAFLIQALMILCGVTSLADLKDELIAEAGLNYETSVRLQRRFEREVLDPITEEAESRGMVFDNGGSASTPQVSLHANVRSDNEPVYHDGRITVFPRWIKRAGATYPVSQISGVTRPFKMPFDLFGGFLLNGGCAVVGAVVLLGGLGALFTSIGSGLGMIAIGAIMALIGGFNVKNCFDQRWIVAVDLINQENLHLEVDSEEKAQKLYEAILCVIS